MMQSLNAHAISRVQDCSVILEDLGQKTYSEHSKKTARIGEGTIYIRHMLVANRDPENNDGNDGIDSLSSILKMPVVSSTFQS